MKQPHILPQEFYARETVSVARDLLGCILIHTTSGRTAGGKIIETEAYLGGDPAARSYRGKTGKNAVLFGPPGRAYVYLVYGLHLCINAVTGSEGSGEAVLLRALEPCLGIPVMEKRRRTTDPVRLCNGPGKLSQALGVTLACNGVPLYEGPLRIVSSDGSPGDTEIVTSTRIGIGRAIERPLRFFVMGNRFVSH